MLRITSAFIIASGLLACSLVWRVGAQATAASPGNAGAHASSRSIAEPVRTLEFDRKAEVSVDLSDVRVTIARGSDSKDADFFRSPLAITAESSFMKCVLMKTTTIIQSLNYQF